MSEKLIQRYEKAIARAVLERKGAPCTIHALKMEILDCELRLCACVTGNSPNDSFAPVPVCARLRHVAGNQWSSKPHMNRKHLESARQDTSVAG